MVHVSNIIYNNFDKEAQGGHDVYILYRRKITLLQFWHSMVLVFSNTLK